MSSDPITDAINHADMLEWINTDEIPEDEITDKLAEWDENTHLSDYPGEVEIDVHYSEEYIQLRSIGLTHPEAEGVINHG